MFAVLRSGRFLALLALGLVLAAVCTAAGIWQIHRYGEKRTANAQLRRNADAPSASVGDVLRVGRSVGADQRLRTISAQGRYDAAGQVLVRQREVNGQAGFLVVAPLRTAGGATLFVVRGFLAAQEWATRTPPIPPPPAGTVAISGRVQPTEPGALRSDLPPGQVQRIDVPALAARAGVPAYRDYAELVSGRPADTGLVALPAPDLGNPAGGALEGQHLAYVVQWLLFAALGLVGPFILARADAKARLGRTPQPTDERGYAGVG